MWIQTFCKISMPASAKYPSSHLLKLYESKCLSFIIHYWKNNNLINILKYWDKKHKSQNHTINFKIIICWRLFWKISRLLPYPSIRVSKNVLIHGQYYSVFSSASGPHRILFLYFLHSNYTENYTENTTGKLKIQQWEAGGRCKTVNCFSFWSTMPLVPEQICTSARLQRHFF